MRTPNLAAFDNSPGRQAGQQIPREPQVGQADIRNGSLSWHNRNEKAVAGTAIARLVVREDRIRFHVPPCPGRQVGQAAPVHDAV